MNFWISKTVIDKLHAEDSLRQRHVQDDKYNGTRDDSMCSLRGISDEDIDRESETKRYCEDCDYFSANTSVPFCYKIIKSKKATSQSTARQETSESHRKTKNHAKVQCLGDSEAIAAAKKIGSGHEGQWRQGASCAPCKI